MSEFKYITESLWIGIPLGEAIDRAKSMNYIHRIVEEDGRSLIVDADVKSNRVNLRVRNNIIIGVYTG
jgi:hypothetical protein